MVILSDNAEIAKGFVEEDEDGVHRLLVGTSREAKDEYIRVVV